MLRLSLLSAILFASLASAAPPDAQTALDGARAQAKREGKNVMVVFHASWCGWCKKFDKMLDDPKLKPVFEKSYVIVHLDVLENGDKKALENAGGEEVMGNLGGKNAGLPFFAIVAPDGKKMGDSLLKDGDPATNTGYPAKPEEIDRFMALLKATAKKTGVKGRSVIENYLKADAIQH